ncbi:MAG: hypothetical protein V4555_02265, partial [Acidobacteriota bacterium]
LVGALAGVLAFLLITALASAKSRPPTAVLTLVLLLALALPIMSLAVFGPIRTGPLQSCAIAAILILSALTPWPSPPNTAAA